MQLKLLVDAGGMKPGPAVSQKLGPLGINLGKVISEVNKATASFKGIKVPVILDIDTKTKEFTIQVLTPPASELLKKEFNIAKGSPQPNKIKVANASIEQIIKVAKIKQQSMFLDSLKPSVKSVLGSCIALGILVESKEPKVVQEEIDKGIYDDLINKGTEGPSKEKLAKLDADFEQVKKSQEAIVKELEKKAEEKAAAAPAATAATTPATATSKEKKK